MRLARDPICILIVALLGVSSSSIPLNQILCQWHMDHDSSETRHSEYVDTVGDTMAITKGHCSKESNELSLSGCCPQCFASTIKTYVAPQPNRTEVRLQQATFLHSLVSWKAFVRNERKSGLRVTPYPLRCFPSYLELSTFLI